MEPEAEAPAKRRKTPAGICHVCRAGQEGVPWEDCFSKQPIWRGTLYEECPFKQAPAFSRVHRCPGKVEDVFTWDLFHSFHLGAGKVHVSSALGVLSDYMEGRNLEARFQALSCDFKAWCLRERQAPPMSNLTASFIGWVKGSKSPFPSGTWSKGSITTVLMRYLEYKLKSMQLTPQDELLRLALEGTEAMNRSMEVLYQSDLFLDAQTALQVGTLGLRFLRRFAVLAKRSHQAGKALWCLIPKLHVLHHVYLNLVLQAECGKLSISPLALANQLNEDWVGRPSRLSRRVDVRKAPTRVLQRLLKACYHQYVQAKYILPG